MTAATAIGGTLAGLGASASLFWMAQVIRAIPHRHRMIRLADLPAVPPEGGWPGLAVIVAARNEQDEVERAIRSMLRLDYPGLKVVAVNDRSTDATGENLKAVAAEDSRLEVVHIRDLPPGWLGKTHALHRAAMASDATWLLLTDADVLFAPDALRKAISYAELHRVDHLTVAPEVPTETVGERLFLAMFQVVFALANPFWIVEDPNRKAHAGIGAFNLVRGEALRAIGGFERLALSVDDDMRLAEALKVSGRRPRFLLGDRAVSVRWQVGLWGLIRGLEKNFFAATGYRTPASLGAALMLLWVGASPHAGLFIGPWWTRIICGVGVATICLFIGLTGGASRIRWYYGLALPLGAAACAFAMLRSTWLTLRRGGVCWREHHYPLGDLRRHVRRRDAWLREVWRSTR